MKELVLHQPPTRAWGTPNTSPFCAKLELYLRITETPYTTAPFKRGQMPKGKIPYVELDGAFIGDSQLIIDELERRRGDRALDAGITSSDRALSRVVRRTLEEGAYFVNLYLKWGLPEGYALVKAEFKQFVPGFVLPIVRREQKKKLHAQGTGRHTYDEVMAMGAADFDAVADLLRDRTFMLGDAPRTIDCCVFAFVDSVLGFPLDSPVKQRVAARANLVAYRQRIRDRWWKDLPTLAALPAG